MRGSRLIYDGLWRCLCPSFDVGAFRRATSSPRILQMGPTKRPCVASACFANGRDLITTAPKQETTWHAPTATEHHHHDPPSGTAGLLMRSSPSEETLLRASVDEIVEALNTIRCPRGLSQLGHDMDKYDRIVQLVHHLVTSRDQPIRMFMYECLMDAMSDPQGSVKGMQKLLEDLAAQNMKPSETLCRSALAALTNHPDYALRQEILDTMQTFWFAMDQRAEQNLLLGWLRDEQYELAYLRLNRMIEQKTPIDVWVVDIFILVFGKLGFLDEMVQLLHWRENVAGKNDMDKDKDEARASVIYYALDVCSRAFHHPGTLFAWNRMVRTGAMTVSDGMAENVLATAARHGDVSLATEALDLMSRRTRVLAHDYEAVVEAFAAGGDVGGALRIVGIMEDNGLRTGRATTRSVYEALRRQPDVLLMDDAEEALRDMAAAAAAADVEVEVEVEVEVDPKQEPQQKPKQKKKKLPAAAVEAVVAALAETQGAAAAMKLYRDMAGMCGPSARAAMLQALMAKSDDAETTHALARDYHDAVTMVREGAEDHEHDAADEDDDGAAHVDYGALVSACAEADELDAAFRFAARVVARRKARQEKASDDLDMDADDHVHSDVGWLKLLVAKAVEREDGRIWTVIDDMRAESDQSGAMVDRVLRQMSMTRRRAAATRTQTMD